MGNRKFIITLFITILLNYTFEQAVAFKPDPNSKPQPHIIEKDYTKVKFIEKIGYKDGDFTVEEVDLSNYDGEWEGVERQFRGDNYFTVALKAKTDVVKI